MKLQIAKNLLEFVEAVSVRLKLKMVFSVCNQYGNMVAVHAMDDAYLVSFDISMKKAYTAAALRLPTIELTKLAAPGQPLFGVDRLDEGRIIIIGGGVPLYHNGVLVGGLGASGGSGEEDHAVAACGAAALSRIIKKA